jgi:outer membrane receptor protein involved in Fe transport
VKIGLQVRRDDIDPVGLYHTAARRRLSTTREDKVLETSFGVYVEDALQVIEWFRAVPGIRADHYEFEVDSNIPQNSGKKDDSIVSPKLSLVFGPWAKTEYFLNAGRGFHSNDARGTTITLDSSDPTLTTPADAVDPLVRSSGAEIGVRTEIIRNLESSLSLWELKLDSELLFVGDAGTGRCPQTRPRKAFISTRSSRVPSD